MLIVNVPSEESPLNALMERILGQVDRPFNQNLEDNKAQRVYQTQSKGGRHQLLVQSSHSHLRVDWFFEKEELSKPLSVNERGFNTFADRLSKALEKRGYLLSSGVEKQKEQESALASLYFVKKKL